jgi:hypothetical protein
MTGRAVFGGQRGQERPLAVVFVHSRLLIGGRAGRSVGAKRHDGWARAADLVTSDGCGPRSLSFSKSNRERSGVGAPDEWANFDHVSVGVAHDSNLGHRPPALQERPDGCAAVDTTRSRSGQSGAPAICGLIDRWGPSRPVPCASPSRRYERLGESFWPMNAAATGAHPGHSGAAGLVLHRYPRLIYPK